MRDEPKELLGGLIQKLHKLAPLDEADRAALYGLPVRSNRVTASQYVVREGQCIDHCTLLLSGYACRHKMTRDGSRQIVSFHLPGDLLDIQHLLLRRADHNVQSVTEAQLVYIPVAALTDLATARPAVMRALWRDSLIDASIFREWVLNVGRRDALARVAHLLCEFAIRRHAAGLGEPEQFELPMSQEQIGDATGLTSVHVNRTLQLLGSEGLIERERRRVSILDWEKLRTVAGFDQAYLHVA